MRNRPQPGDDIIDSRDVIEAIVELESEIEALTEESVDSTRADDQWPALIELREELAVIKAFADDAEEVSDWSYGETFIEDSHFETYAQQLAEDCCENLNTTDWPARCIDWEQAARELQMDYTSYEFGGYTYWARC